VVREPALEAAPPGGKRSPARSPSTLPRALAGDERGPGRSLGTVRRDAEPAAGAAPAPRGATTALDSEPAGAPRPPQRELDIDRLVERVERKILRNLAIERERTGGVR